MASPGMFRLKLLLKARSIPPLMTHQCQCLSFTFELNHQHRDGPAVCSRLRLTSYFCLIQAKESDASSFNYVVKHAVFQLHLIHFNAGLLCCTEHM